LLSPSFTLKIPLVNTTATQPLRVFGRDAIVLVTLNDPREKFWGAVLDLTAAGVSLRGIDLNSFEDFAQSTRAEDPITPGAVFFPMHRVERIDLDIRSGSIPSLCERFASKTGQDPVPLFQAIPRALPGGCTLAEAERRFVETTLAAVNYDFPRAAAALGISPEQVREILTNAAGSESR
jgi:hypothetical protein